MGGMKDMMLEREGDLAAAADYLVERGNLEKCEYHDEIFGGASWDLESDFWRDVTIDKNMGINGPVPWAADMEHKDFRRLLEDAYNNHCGDECSYCAKHANE